MLLRLDRIIRCQNQLFEIKASNPFGPDGRISITESQLIQKLIEQKEKIKNDNQSLVTWQEDYARQIDKLRELKKKAEAIEKMLAEQNIETEKEVEK